MVRSRKMLNESNINEKKWITLKWCDMLWEREPIKESSLPLIIGNFLLQTVTNQWIQSITTRWWRWWSGMTARWSWTWAAKRWWKRWECVGPDADNLLCLWVSCQRFVVAQVNVIQVTNLPALTTKVAKNVAQLKSERKKVFWNSPEARKFTTIVRSMLNTTQRTKRILQVRIDLHLLCELWRFYFDEGCGHGTHVRACVVEGNAPRSDWIFVFVGVDACRARKLMQLVINLIIIDFDSHQAATSLDNCGTHRHKPRHRTNHSWS